LSISFALDISVGSSYKESPGRMMFLTRTSVHHSVLSGFQLWKYPWG